MYRPTVRIYESDVYSSLILMNERTIVKTGFLRGHLNYRILTLDIEKYWPEKGTIFFYTI